MSGKKGFTLVELLVVVSILAILATIGFSVYSGLQKSARDVKRRSDLAALQNAISQYYLENRSFPTELRCSYDGSGDWASDFKNALEPRYIKQVPKDPLNGQESCSGARCQYCFSQSMWCADSSTAYPCNSGIGNLYTFQESCSGSTIGDSAWFKYGCPHFMKAIEPL